MALTPSTAQRVCLCAAAAGVGFVAVLLSTVSAAAQPANPPPNCTAADLAGIASGVAASTSAYLFTRPDANAFFTGLHDRPHDEVPTATREYFDAHPQQHTDLRAIRQPLVDFRNRCGLPAPAGPSGE